jgi:hypothetical protein
MFSTRYKFLKFSLKPNFLNFPKLQRRTMSKISMTPTRVTTNREMRAEEKEQERLYLSQDVLERLRAGAAHAGEWIFHKHFAANVRDAIAEIEWLRAQHPEAVTRGEVEQMAVQLREMQDTITALLGRVEKGANGPSLRTF